MMVEQGLNSIKSSLSNDIERDTHESMMIGFESVSNF